MCSQCRNSQKIDLATVIFKEYLITDGVNSSDLAHLDSSMHNITSGWLLNREIGFYCYLGTKNRGAGFGINRPFFA